MNTAEGVVETIRVGRGVSVSISNNWYGAGFDADKIPFKEGNKIKFTYTEKGIYKNIDLNSVEILDASEVSNAQPKETSSKVKVRAGATLTSNDYWSKKEEEDKLRSKEIRYEACLQRAIAMVSLLITSGAVSLGANTKKKSEIVEKTVETFTRVFYTQATEARDGAYDAPSSDDLNKDLGEDTSYE
jgi:hypothetical protein